MARIDDMNRMALEEARMLGVQLKAEQAALADSKAPAILLYMQASGAPGKRILTADECKSTIASLDSVKAAALPAPSQAAPVVGVATTLKGKP